MPRIGQRVTLDLCGSNIEILDPIRDLRNIERLNVSKNRLRDLQALHMVSDSLKSWIFHAIICIRWIFPPLPE